MGAAADVAAAATTSPEHRAREAIRTAGYMIDELVRILPPLDSGRPVEVLFRGRRSLGDSTALFTAYVADEQGAKATISAGW